MLVRHGAQRAGSCHARPVNRFEGWFGRFNPRDRLVRRLKTKVGTLNFVRLMVRGMA